MAIQMSYIILKTSFSSLVLAICHPEFSATHNQVFLMFALSNPGISSVPLHSSSTPQRLVWPYPHLCLLTVYHIKCVRMKNIFFKKADSVFNSKFIMRLQLSLIFGVFCFTCVWSPGFIYPLLSQNLLYYKNSETPGKADLRKGEFLKLTKSSLLVLLVVADFTFILHPAQANFLLGNNLYSSIIGLWLE